MTPFAGAGLTHPNDAFMLRRARFGQWTPLLVLVCASAAAVLAETLVPEDMERYWLALAGDWTLAHGRILEALQGSGIRRARGSIKNGSLPLRPPGCARTVSTRCWSCFSPAR